uniref:Macrophage-expressed gene 1 protein n=1 Tax=Panagrolaimus sp. ES5 TaxID=591445 RepID=A0AC34F097_9BILA
MGNMITTTTPGIVGVGWDDLTNEMTLPILATKFDQCKTTPDGHFLIPDNVLARKNIRANRDGMGSFVGGGSYSRGNQEIKKHFSNKNTMMLEAQIGYKAFIFIAEAKELDAAFQIKIDEIIESLYEERLTLAQYQAECLIRDYGTHVVNKALTGASMKYKAFVGTEGLHEHDATVSKMESEAAITFLGLLSADKKSESENRMLSKNGFEQRTQYSTIETKGGADVRNVLSAKDESAISRMDNIVGLEHEGIPIYTIIHKSYFPGKDYTTSILLTVQNLIRNATNDYYSKNTISGCTNPTAGNFDYQSNFDDGTCNDTKREFIFDGVFQKYNLTSYVLETSSHTRGLHRALQEHVDKMLPKHYTINHPLTNEPACPQGYNEVLLSTSSVHSANIVGKSLDEIYDGLTAILKNIGGSYYISAEVKYETYWCRRNNNTNTAHEGALFGGFVLDGKNILTNTPGCPHNYKHNKLYDNIDICLCYDYNAGKQHAIPFAGFYSCLSEEQQCPPGFSSHLLTFLSSKCGIFYCVHPDAHNFFVEPVLQRPPFIDYYKVLKNTQDEIPSDYIDEIIPDIVKDLNVTDEINNITLIK